MPSYSILPSIWDWGEREHFDRATGPSQTTFCPPSRLQLTCSLAWRRIAERVTLVITTRAGSSLSLGVFIRFLKMKAHCYTVHCAYMYAWPTNFLLQDSAPGIILAHGSIGPTLSDTPDLYISRDGGVSWAQTLTGSYGVTVVDHGGLLVAADDYHKEPSHVLKYSCDEGLTWSSYSYVTTDMTIYGVITEPGEETTTVRYM